MGATSDGLTGLGSRGTGPGGAPTGLGLGATGVVGGRLGPGAMGFKGTHRSVTVVCDLPGFSDSNGYTRDEVLRVVKRHHNKIVFCYEQGLPKRPELSGKIAVKWVIAGDGTVSMAETSESSLGSPDVEACVLSRVRRWRFPPHEAGEVVIRFPWVFSVAGAGPE